MNNKKAAYCLGNNAVTANNFYVFHNNSIPKDRTDSKFDESKKAASYKNDGYGLDDIGNGKRLANRFKNIIGYCHEQEKWYYFNGKVWEVSSRTSIEGLAKIIMRELLDEATEEESEEFLKFAKSCQSAAKIRAMVEMAKSEEDIRVYAEDFDSNSNVFVCNNGTFYFDQRNTWGKIIKGKLIRSTGYGFIPAFDPTDKVTLMSHNNFLYPERDMTIKNYGWSREIPYHELAPKFREAMKKYHPSTEIRKFILRAYASCFEGGNKDHKFIVNFGKGANGKSTVDDLFEKIMGDYAERIQTSTLMQTKFGNASHASADMATLQGKRFVLGSETKKGAIFDEAIIKEMTNTKTKVKALYENQKKMDIDFTPFIDTNWKPILKDTGYSTERRIVVVSWDYTITEEEKDPHFVDKLFEEEGDEIFTLFINHFWGYKDEGKFIIPPAIKATTEQYFEEMNLSKKFLNDCCNADPDAEEKAQDVYTSYCFWCDAENIARLGRNSFYQALEDEGVKIALNGKKTKCIYRYELKRKKES